jgi:cytochrome c oxidase subunit II
MNRLFSLLPFFALLAAPSALADPIPDHMPKPWQLGFQTPASPVMEQLYAAHDYLLILITAISLFVLVLLIYICLRFSRKANPVPSKTTHNMRLEVIWTVIPILILVAIAIPSLRLHYYMEDESKAEMTLKVVGYQWYWHYEYPDHGGFGFDSYMKKDKELKPGDHRLLAVDNRVVVPVDTNIRVQLTGADVIHAWALPAFGLKRDAMPGRLNETWFKATTIGTFYGQCSELCGVGHGFMPIVVDVVSKEDFAKWVKEKQKEAGAEAAPADKASDKSVEKDKPAAKEAEKEKAKEPEKAKDADKKKEEKKPAEKAEKKKPEPAKSEETDEEEAEPQTESNEQETQE